LSARSSTYRDGITTFAPALALMMVVLLFGIHLPGPLKALLDEAASALEAGR